MLRGTPSQLYRLYWTGRYLERIDLTSRSLLAALSSASPEEALAGLARSLGREYGGLWGFLEDVLYGREGSLVHAARMIRLNLMGLGSERLSREANMLVLLAENRVERSLDSVRSHLQDILSAALRLGEVLEAELTVPPTPPAEKLREQLMHQQQ